MIQAILCRLNEALLWARLETRHMWSLALGTLRPVGDGEIFRNSWKSALRDKHGHHDEEGESHLAVREVSVWLWEECMTSVRSLKCQTQLLSREAT